MINYIIRFVEEAGVRSLPLFVNKIGEGCERCMQLTLDHLMGAGETIVQVIDKWAMLDFFDRNFGETGLMVYETESCRFRLPFQFGEFHFSSCSLPIIRNFWRLYKMESKHSCLQFDHTLTSLIETNAGYKAVYARSVGSGKQQFVETDLPGQAYFLLRKYPLLISRFPRLDKNLNQNEVFAALIGSTVHIKARVNGDWLNSIVSIPFKVETIDVANDVILITGSHDTEFMIKGFQGIRVEPEYGYVIFDVFDKSHGYTRTFYLMKSVKC